MHIQVTCIIFIFISRAVFATFCVRKPEWWDYQVVKNFNDVLRHLDIKHECH